MSKINKIKLSGTTYDIQDLNATSVVNVTQAQYDALVTGGTVDPTTLYNITDAQAGDLSQYWTSAQTNSAITQAVSGKQDTLVSGTNIKTINNESILGSGNIDIQGGGSIDVDSVLSTTSENPVQNKVITNTLNNLTQVLQNNDNGHVRWYDVRKHDNTVLFNINNFSINGRMPLSKQNGTDSNIDNFSLVETSAITTSISSTSTHAQIPSAKAVYDAIQEGGGGGTVDQTIISGSTNAVAGGAVYDKFDEVEQVTAAALNELNEALSGKVDTSTYNTYTAATDSRLSEDEEVTAASLNALNDNLGGLKLVKLTQTEYNSLATKDASTLYIIVN